MQAHVSREAELQRRYYAETAHKYNAMHVHEKDEHYFALGIGPFTRQAMWRSWVSSSYLRVTIAGGWS